MNANLTPQTKKRRRLFLLIALLIGAGLGTATVLGATGYWLKSYVESQAMLQDLSKALNQNPPIELSSATTKFSFFPPSVLLKGLEAKSKGQRTFLMRQCEVSAQPLSLLVGVVSVRVGISEIKFFSVEGEPTSKSQATPKKAEFKMPSLPYVRRLDLDLAANDIRLAQSFVPQFDVELKASLATGAKNEIKVETLRALGIRLSANSELDQSGSGPFEINFPEKESLLAGKLTGQLTGLGEALQIKGALKLPNVSMPVPNDAHWLVGAKPVELKGTAALSGGVSFEYAQKAQSPSVWSADASWDLNLTQATLVYGVYEKKPGKTATAHGKFLGNAESWKLSDTSLVLGQVTAELNADQAANHPTHLAAKVAPFEISEFVPLLMKASKAKPTKITGRASGDIDLLLSKEAPDAPSGKVNFVLENATLDGAALQGLTQKEEAKDDEGPQLSGELSLKADVNSDLDRGVFKNGIFKIGVDATSLGVMDGDNFQKKAAVPLKLDVAGEGSGKSILVRSLKVTGPSGMQISAKGAVTDLKDYLVKFQILDSKIPLETASELFPKIGTASGVVALSGEIDGSLKNVDSLSGKLNWDLKNISLQRESHAVTKLAGKIETLVTSVEEDLGRSGLVRLFGVSAIWQPKLMAGEELKPVSVHADGNIGYKARALSGNVQAKLSEVDLKPWLSFKASEKPSSEPSMIDYKKSDFKFSAEMPALLTPYLNFQDVRLALKMGAAGSSDAEFKIEKLSGRTLGGELNLSATAKLATLRTDINAAGLGISMPELSKFISKMSGKDLEASFFGTANIEVKGGLNASLATSDFQGHAEIKDGGFKFLPLPKKFLDDVRQLPRVGDKLPPEKVTINDRFEKAEANFHMKADRIDLDIQTIDPFLTMTSKGHVTLAGHCDMNGLLHPKSQLVGSTLVQYLDSGVPFKSVGDNWVCGFKPDYGDLAVRVLKSKAIEQVKAQATEKVQEKIQDAVQDKLKGIFGK